MPRSHAVEDLGLAVDDAFSSWHTGAMTTKELRKTLKKIGVGHDRLNPRGAGGSIEVFDPSGNSLGWY